VLGTEFSGEVAATGRGVTRLAVGDRVFGSTGSAGGCYAEYVCIPGDGFIATMPANLPYPEGAPVCGALAAWNFLCDKARVGPGQRVLVNGAAGDIGTAAIQLAKHLGAEVTGVCGAANVELVESLGADAVIDAGKEDFTRARRRYDVVFDIGGGSSFSRCKTVLTRDGIYLSTYPGPAIFLQMLWTSRLGRRRAVFSATGLLPVAERLAFLDEVKRLIAAGELRTVVDSCYPLDRIADAYRRADRGDTGGTVVVTVDGDGPIAEQPG